MPKFKTVVPPNCNERVDKYLAEVMALARNQIQRLIASDLVTINGRIAVAHDRLRGGEEVEVMEAEARVANQTVGVTYRTIAAESDYLVIYKPVGAVMHPAPGVSAPTLSDALLVNHPELNQVGEPGRYGIVHRLDKDVSGLIVAARTAKMYEHLKNEFKEHRVVKRYTALVNGVVANPEGVMTFVMARSKRTGRMAARPVGQVGRAAETRFVVLRRYARATLLEVTLVTGRTHQIRAHFLAFGHSLVGDPLYRARKSKVVSNQFLSRPFLEATYLGFNDLTGQWREYTIPLDDELVGYLNTL